MAVRVADNLKTANDSTEFPVAFGNVVWLNKDKSGTTEDYSDLQTMYDNDELGNGGSAIQVDLLPPPSVDELGKIYEFIGSTGTYVNGYFYECVSDGEPTPTYSWVQKNVQPNVNIVDTAIEIDSTWSSKKINDSLVNITDKLEKKADVSDLANKQDFRIFNSLEEFNEKKGTSLTVVSGIDNMKDIANAMSEGDMLIIRVIYINDSEIYFGLDTSTGWAKMFTFIKSNGLCDVECRTTTPLTLKRVLNPNGVIGEWQQLATTDSTLKTIQLSGSVDCNTLTELGLYTASAGAVSALTNAPVNNQVHLDGGFSVLVTKTNADSIYYGMQMFIPYGSDAPFIRKAYYFNNGQYWTSWEQVATQSNLSTYYHKCIYARTNNTGSELVKTLTLEDGKCYTIEGYQGDNYKRTRVFFFSGTIRTIDEITSQLSPFTLSNDGNVLTITFANWSYNQCRIYEESPANGANIG